MIYNKIKNKLPKKVKKLGIKILKKQYAGHEERFFVKYNKNKIVNQAWIAHYLIYKKMLEYAESVPTLDLCCGSGGGTALLSDHIKERIFGIDYSEDAINFAKKNNQNSLISYEKLDLNKNKDIDDLKKIIIFNKIKQVFFIEGIEHIKYPEKITNLLIECGIKKILISTPFEKEHQEIKGYHCSPFTPSFYKKFSEKFNSKIIIFAKFIDSKKVYAQIMEGMNETDIFKECFTKEKNDAINYLILIDNSNQESISPS